MCVQLCFSSTTQMWFEVGFKLICKRFRVGNSWEFVSLFPRISILLLKIHIFLCGYEMNFNEQHCYNVHVGKWIFLLAVTVCKRKELKNNTKFVI